MSGQWSDDSRRPLSPQGVPISSAAVVPCRPGAHVGTVTTVDERSRRLSHEELAVADQLATEGHRVRSLAERRGQGPVADLEVCGTRVEIKSFLSLPEREGRIPTARSVCNKLLSAREQAPTAVLFAPGSGLSEEVARAGVQEFVDRGRPGRVTAVRILGDDFDLSWATGLARQREATGERSTDRQEPTGRTDAPRSASPDSTGPKITESKKPEPKAPERTDSERYRRHRPPERGIDGPGLAG